MSVSHQQKVYLPQDARTNQYICAELKITDELINQYEDINQCYRQLANQVFELAEQLNLTNLHVIANDKVPVVRFHTEAYCIQSIRKIIFFYNAKYHQAQNLFFTPDYRAKKVRLLFLATGEDIRMNSAAFHGKVQTLVDKLSQTIPDDVTIKIRDHQHITYDLFAKSKGNKASHSYKLRGVIPRYKARECELPDTINAINFVVASLPISRHLKQLHTPKGTYNYQELYQFLQDKFTTAADIHHFNRIAMVANGRVPLVRNSKFEKPNNNENIDLLGFKPNVTTPQIISLWQPDNLVESAYFVIVAGDENCSSEGYGRFMNRVETMLKSFAKEIGMDKAHEDLMIRFHQHLSYPK
ncbi:DUF3083 family protein [Shewanella marina]|uniref:DUF3083 family protein n=1 Tax=Shewanella marina TaxID=487319 RepID=UPI0004719814|nr:DUF3083 family protein [Shewanella marina]